MDLSVIIVNYNVKYFLEHCLISVLKACKDIEAEIFVVDNNSTDGSKEYLEGRFPSVIFKWQKANLGFGKANNSVLPEAKGAHILFLNPDTIIPEDCFEKCLLFFKENKDCAALGVHMTDGTGNYLKESKRSFPSALTSFFKMTGFAALFPSSKIFAKYYAGHLPEKQSNEVDVLAGAFMMLNEKAIKAVKGFDEDFFMYGEDIDLSYRIQQAGLKNFYFPGTSIIHFKGESTQKNSGQYTRTFYNAMQLFVRKHYKERKAAYFFMKMAISFSRVMATVKLFVRRMFVNGKKGNKQANTAVVADQPTFDNILHLLRHAKLPIITSGRIAIDNNDPGVFIGGQDNIDEAIKKYQLEQLIFCEGGLTYKRIIELASEFAGRLNFLFHSKDSHSIVGSNDKNEKGIFIADQ